MAQGSPRGNMRRNQLAVWGRKKRKDPGFRCMTAVSSYHSCSQRPEEKKEGTVEERKGMRRTTQLGHFLLRSQHLLKFLVDVQMRVEEAKGSWSYTSCTVLTSTLACSSLLSKSSATFSISGLKPHEYLIQFQMIWKTLNPSNTG